MRGVNMNNNAPAKKAHELTFAEIKIDFPLEKIAKLKNTPVASNLVGQDRAIEAIKLGIGIPCSGYNIFIMGASGTGRRTVLLSLLKDYKLELSQLQDIAYVYNFAKPLEPQALFFPAGEGRTFKNLLKKAVESIYKKTQQKIKSESFLSEQKKIISKAKNEENNQISALELKMLKQGFAIRNTKDEENPSLDVIPLYKGKETSFDELQMMTIRKKLSEKTLNTIKEVYYSALDELSNLFVALQDKQRETDEKIKQLYKNSIEPIIKKELATIQAYVQEHYQVQNTTIQKEKIESILAYLQNIEKDLLKRTPLYGTPFKSVRQKKVFFERYDINLICEHRSDKNYIITENLPNFSNLFGTIESRSDDGESVVNGHMHIRSGSVHQALGGFLILRLKDLLEEDDSWIYLKRVLQSNKIEIQVPPSSNHNQSIFKPESLPASFKVVLIGGDYTYDILYQEDADFYKLFKIPAEFDSVMQCTDENIAAFIKLMDKVIQEQKSLPFDDSGYAQMLSYASELAESRNLLTTQFTMIADMIAESNFTAQKKEQSIITAETVQDSINRRKYLYSLPQQKFAEMIGEKEILIDVSGKKIGKLNGLAVEERGYHCFGAPVSISAQASPGNSGVINIEREAGLSGEIYDKAHLIITSLLREKFAQDFQLAISAAVCFEQSYSWVDGDSASVAEFLALLSAIGKIPLRQDIAVTGSLNQLGMIQPIGGVSEKIIGFYDTCCIIGLTGSQGVMIPASNKNNLFLPDRILNSIKDGSFHIWTIGDIDEGIELMSSQPYEVIQKKVRNVLKEFCEKVKKNTQ